MSRTDSIEQIIRDIQALTPEYIDSLYASRDIVPLTRTERQHLDEWEALRYMPEFIQAQIDRQY